MADEKSEKKKLYDKVSAAPVWTVVQRMRSLGFWPAGTGLPEDPWAESTERAHLVAERQKLLSSAVVDAAAALAAERKRRIEESRKKRAQKKTERDKAAEQARQVWARQRAKGVVFSGVGVSAGLQDVKSNQDKLLARGLPVVHDAADLARALSLSLPELRFLTFHRRGAATVHYHRYDIAKKTGGTRAISAPKPKLAAAQRWVFDSILLKLPVEPEANGFVAGKSIVSNAAPHVQKAVVFNLDLKDFFPTVGFRRVKGLFMQLGYSENVATLLSLLCTEPPRVPVDIDDKRVWIALGERHLPQGACTSPSITNLLCRRLDRRLAGLARRHRFSYTRYADDLTFSGDNRAAVGRLMRSVRAVIAAEGFFENDKKTRVMGRGRRQEVTGVVVNQRPAVARDEVRKLRAVLHNAARHGLSSQNRTQHPDFAAHLQGRVAFIEMVDPPRGARLRVLLQRALKA